MKISIVYSGPNPGDECYLTSSVAHNSITTYDFT